jgi:hypothetical protein
VQVRWRQFSLEIPMRKDTRSKVRRAVRLLASAMGIKLEQSHSQKGRWFEARCAKICRNLGYQVIDVSKKQERYDLLVNGHRVQCKTRKKQPAKNGFGVLLAKSSERKYLVSEVDFFVISYMKTCYVIPAKEILNKGGEINNWVLLSNKYHYINAWGQLEGERIEYEQQKKLF